MSSRDVLGWTIPPTFVNLQYEPTRALPAMVWRKTSTPKTSATMSHVSESQSVWTRATWSLQEITFPRAESLSSRRWMTTVSGRELRRCWSSVSVVVEGTRRPREFPTVTRPTKRQPER